MSLQPAARKLHDARQVMLCVPLKIGTLNF